MFNEANVLIPLVISINDKIIELVKLLKGRIGKNKLYKVVKTTMLPNIIMEEENAFMMLFFSVSENCNFCFFIILLESFEMYLLRIIKPKIKFDKYIDNNIFIPIWKELKIIVPIVFIINKGFGKNVKASNLFAS